MICHHNKCIFVHIPKNAGQSIEHVFLNLLNLTWDTRAPLLLRYNDRPELGPPRLAHLKAEEYVRHKYLTQEIFDDYFKFAYVRNPWSRLISMYKYLGYDHKYTFKKFLMGTFKDSLFTEKYWFVGPQSEYIYTEEGDLLVDFIGRFENLQNDFEHVCKKTGIPSTQLPHINGSNEGDSVFSSKPKFFANMFVRRKSVNDYQNYKDYYDQEAVDLVANLYKRDIELFNYDY